jgi:hypothetical protein
MGIDAYVSRSQLEGAAVTRRLAIVRNRSAVVPGAIPLIENRPAVANPATGRPQIPKLEFSAKETPRTAAQPAVEAASSSATAPVPPFSLAALVVGDWLWLEELPGMPLTREQVQLIRAMASVLAIETGRVQVGAAPPAAKAVQKAQFNWPIHTNQQLDLGPEAARSAVAGFIRRKLEEHGCRGLVLLGRDCAARVPLAQLDCTQVVHTVSSAEMLQNGLLKKQAWLDLRSLVGRG